MARYRPLISAGFVLALVLSQGSGLAFAQAVGREPPASPYDPYQDQRLGLLPNGCIKWCYQDKTPCDPAYFKQADGRCAQQR
jgi:hypothetical protein